MRPLTIFLILFSSLYSADTDTPYDVNLSYPHQCVRNLVNPLSGQISHSETDIIVKGAQEIPLNRTYFPSPLSKNRANEIDPCQNFFSLVGVHRGWKCFPHSRLDWKNGVLQLLDLNGSILEFVKVKGSYQLKSPKIGTSNLQGETPSALFDPRNISIKEQGYKIIVQFPDGRIRSYMNNFLEKEVLPNGKILRYFYDQQSLIRVESRDPSDQLIYAFVDIASDASGEKMTFSSSNQMSAEYHFDKFQLRDKGKTFNYPSPNILSTVHGDVLRSSNFTYSNNLSTESLKFGNLKYDCHYSKCGSLGDKISELSCPNGNEKFLYNPTIAGIKSGLTAVIHSDGSFTRYYFTSNLLLTQIIDFEKIGKKARIKKFIWNSSNQLSAILIQNSKKKTLLKRTFEYDRFGNPIKESLNDERVTLRSFSQDGRNLLLTEQTGEKFVQYDYLPGTNLITVRQTYHNSNLLTTETWKYDQYHNLIEERVQDKIIRYVLREEAPFLHMRKEKKELYVENEQEILLSRVEYTYDLYGNICEEKVFDSNNHYVYTIQKKYDSRGLLLAETNKSGQKATYQYDCDGRLESKTSFSGNLITQHQYDLARNIKSLSEIPSEGEMRQTTFSYDSLNRLIKKTNPFGLSSSYTYKPFVQNPIEIQLKDHENSISYKAGYDLFGRRTEEIDPNGNKTTKTYNSYGELTKIIHPDLSEENFTYDSLGLLATSIDQNRVKTHYQRDCLDRVLEKKIFSAEGSLLLTESNTYEGLNLKSATNAEGLTTTYQYDGASRKIAETDSGRTIKYEYNPLGQLTKKVEGERTYLYEYDLEDRIISESIVDSLGKLYKNKKYAYDEDGNCSIIQHSESHEDHFSYDSYGRKIRTDDLEIRYDDASKTETTLKKNGSMTIIKNGLHGKPILTQIIDIHGNILSEKIETYDNFGNLKSTQEDSLLTLYAYDNRNRVTSETQGSRCTAFRYTPTGKLATKILPDQTILSYSYDPLDHLKALKSSDGSIDISYEYDRLGFLKNATDQTTHLSLTLTRDPWGNILKEQYSDGFWLERKFDSYNRVTLLSFPEGSLAFEWNPASLHRITRYQNHVPLYEHLFTSYDLSGKLLEEIGIDGLKIAHQYDSRGRCTDILSNHYKESAQYDEVGNLIQTLQNGLERSFEYNFTNQLIQENNFVYDYDKNQNRIRKNLNVFEFNDSNENEFYDKRGNLLKDPSYQYDALNRLTKTNTSHFTYDPIGRKIRRTENGLTERILFDGINELAVYQDKLTLLRVPGPPNSKNTTFPVAIELDDHAYAAISDTRGNVAILVDRNTKTVSHEYAYSSFGEPTFTHETTFNPWRYKGKRYESTLGLIDFGKRFYDPALGRWLTPDPLRFADSTNLYQYCLNNPHYYWDPDGEFIFFALAIPLCATAEITFGTILVETLTVAAMAFIVYETVPMIEQLGNDIVNGHSWDYFMNQKGKNNGPRPKYVSSDLKGDGLTPPLDDLEWKGRGGPEAGLGAWNDINGEFSFHPDFNHPPPTHGHWDFNVRGKGKYQLFDDDSWTFIPSKK